MHNQDVLCLIIWQLVSTVTSQTTLQIGWLVPSSSHPAANFPFNASSSIAALALGIEFIQNQSLLQDYTINVTMLDSGCSSKQGLGVLTDQLFVQPLDVVIGPPCANVQGIGELLAYRNIPLLNWVSTGQSIAYKDELDTYIRTMAPVSSLGGIMTLFYYYTGWRRLIIVSSEDDDYAAAAETIVTNLAFHSVNGFNIVHHHEKINTGATTEEIDPIFRTIIREGRIIILVVPRDELRSYMLRAYALGMTGGDYQFLFTDPTLADSQDIEIITSDVLWKIGDNFDIQARQAFENVLYFVLGHSTTNMTDWSATAMAAVDRVFSGRADLPTPVQPDEYSAYLHDTVVLYARILNKSLSENDTARGSDIFKWAYSVFFKGLSGDVVMNYIGDRQPTFFVYDLNSDGKFHQVASLYYRIDGDQIRVNSTFTRIIWGNGQNSDKYIPPDTPACGFFNEYCSSNNSTDNTLVISVSVSVSMLVVLLVLFLMFRWWRYERGLNSMAWKILPCELNYAITKRVHSSLYLSGKINQSAVSMNSSSIQGTFRSIGNLSQARLSINRGQIFTTVALYKGDIVAVKKSFKRKITIDRTFMLEMKHISEMKHSNLTNLLGVCTVPDHICSVWEYCNKGSLQDVIENDDIRLDTMFKLSIAVDICQGLEYIHKSPIKTHGNLKSTNCVIDSRWVCKLTDFGLQKLKTTLNVHSEETGEHAAFARLLWTAPEILRQILEKQPLKCTQPGDIYAVGIILKELVCRNEPYCDSAALSPKEIIMKVAYKQEDEEAFRPVISDTELDNEYRETNMAYLIHRCWAEEPENRPSIKSVLRTLNKINPYKKSSVVDNMIAMMERYTNNLEDIVAERTEQLQEEKRKTDALLYRMLPKKVAEDLKFGRSVEAEAFDSVTIYFSDIVEFTNLAGESSPLEIVALLNALYTLFDDIISHYDVYKVETIGDAYMIVSGLPERNGNQHVREIANVALDILENVLPFRIPHKPDRQLQLRIGLHTGSVVAGVVGLTMPRYCLFGDTVNTASRMESNGKPLKIHLSSSTNEALSAFPSFVTDERGEIPIKGKGMMRTYWLLGRNGACSLINTEKFMATEKNKPPGKDPHVSDSNETIALESKERNVKDSGVSMTLDNECCDESYDLETNSLRKALKDLYKKSPEERVCESAKDAKTLERNAANFDITDANDSNSMGVLAKNQIEVFKIERPEKKHIPKYVKMTGISEKYDETLPDNIKALQKAENKGRYSYSQLNENTMRQKLWLGHIYHQQKFGSKTLEIYENDNLPEDNNK